MTVQNLRHYSDEEKDFVCLCQIKESALALETIPEKDLVDISGAYDLLLNAAEILNRALHRMDNLVISRLQCTRQNFYASRDSDGTTR